MLSFVEYILSVGFLKAKQIKFSQFEDTFSPWLNDPREISAQVGLVMK